MSVAPRLRCSGIFNDLSFTQSLLSPKVIFFGKSVNINAEVMGNIVPGCFFYETRCMLPCRIWFCVKGCKHKYRRTPKIGERWNSALLGWETWLTPRYTPSPMCYHVKLGSLATYALIVRINRMEPQNWRHALWVVACLTLKTSPLSILSVTTLIWLFCDRGFKLK